MKGLPEPELGARPEAGWWFLTLGHRAVPGAGPQGARVPTAIGKLFSFSRLGAHRRCRAGKHSPFLLVVVLGFTLPLCDAQHDAKCNQTLGQELMLLLL